MVTSFDDFGVGGAYVGLLGPYADEIFQNAIYLFFLLSNICCARSATQNVGMFGCGRSRIRAMVIGEGFIWAVPKAGGSSL